MKFEDALSELRKGKKIRHPHFPEDEYFAGCYVTFKFAVDSIKELEDAKKRGMSIVKMKGDKQHPDMGTAGDLGKINWDDINKQCKHGNYPQLNLLLIMSDDWEVF